MMLFNRSLSADQIKLLYENQTDKIHFNETEVGDVWQACVTPNDGYDDGLENCSNSLAILAPSCIDNDGDGAYHSSSDPSCADYWDCDDNNATLFPPMNDKTVNTNITLCSGTYYINDTGSTGVVIFGANSVELVCNNTALIGNSSGTGVYASGLTTPVMRGCNFSNYSEPVDFRLSTYCGLYNISVYDSQWGVELWRCPNSTLDDIRSWDIPGYGVHIQESGNSTLSNIKTWENGRGVYIQNSGESNLTSISSWNNSGEGIYVHLSNNCSFLNVTVTNHSAGNYGMKFVYSNYSVVQNSTFVNNDFGVSLSFSTGNLFYYNNFSNSASLHASTNIGGNHFNTTNDTCGAQCARGNFWDDILTLNIYDSNSDGYGDYGSAYPYNSTNGGSVSVNVTDWGPITNKTPTIVYSNATITIYGLNGTELTTSRNVFLNISYNAFDTVNCRWANDDESYLINYSFENCTTVKAWILSGGEGNKTVYMEVLYFDNTSAVFNDSIIYRFIQDFTAPTAPTVYDGRSGDDIDWWNSNNTLHAHWFNATDDISTLYYRYRILNNSACFGSCSWTDVGTDTEVTVSGLYLREGRNFSFEVVAYNPSGFNATGTSDGAIIDLTKPSTPTVNSSSHPIQTTPYPESTALLNWSATDSASGIEGYSYLLDTHPGTAPDNTIEERYWETLATMHRGTYNQTLKTNSTGLAYAVFSQIDTNITENESIRVKVALAEQLSDYDDLMGVKVYLAKDVGEAGISVFDMESDAVSNIEEVSWDIQYAETMNLAKIYQFNLTVNETVDDNNDDIYVVVAGITTDDDNRNLLAIGGTDTLSLVDNSTKNYVCDESNACSENTSTIDYAIEIERQDSGDDWDTQYEYLGDGTYYFHVKAKDIAGNWGDTEHYRIMVAAGGVSIRITSPVDGEIFTTTGSEANITVRVLVSGNASVYVAAIHPDGSSTNSSSVVFDTSYEFENITLDLGQNELYAVANTSAGAVTHSPSVYVNLYTGRQPVTNKTLTVEYDTCGPTVGAHICYVAEAANTMYVGMANEEDNSASGTSVQTDTETNSIKIFMARPFDTAELDSQFADNDFLDRVNPMFSYDYGAAHYAIRNELRYDDIYLGGDFYIPAGTYQLYLRKTGVTTDGKYNVTLVIE
jgi:hypothetical protein